MISSDNKHTIVQKSVVFAWLGAVACSSAVMVPPRIDLADHEVIGVTEFVMDDPGQLGSYTTREFIEAIRQDQGLVRIMELGSEQELLRRIGHDRFDAEAYWAIAEQYGLRTMFRGQMEVSDIKPAISASPGLGRMSVAADVDVTLAVQMIETGSGASLWSASNRGRQRVGHISLFDGNNIAFDASDPEDAYGELVHFLIDDVTADFRVSWQRR